MFGKVGVDSDQLDPQAPFLCSPPPQILCLISIVVRDASLREFLPNADCLGGISNGGCSSQHTAQG